MREGKTSVFFPPSDILTSHYTPLYERLEQVNTSIVSVMFSINELECSITCSGKMRLPPVFRICDLGSREVMSLLVSRLWVTSHYVTMHSSKTPSEALLQDTRCSFIEISLNFFSVSDLRNAIRLACISR